VGDKKAESSPPLGAREAQSGPHGVAEPEQPGLTPSLLANDQEPGFHQLRKLQFLDYIWILGVPNRPQPFKPGRAGSPGWWRLREQPVQDF
jgi:hypothetical protein